MKKGIGVAIAVVVVLAILGFVFAAGKDRKFAKQQPAGTGSASAQALFDEAAGDEQKNELLKAKEAYQQLVANYPDFKEISTVQKKLEDVNMRIIFSATQTPKTTVYEVQTGDSLIKIAKKFNTTVELVKRENNLPGDTIRLGQKLRVWQGVFSVLVDKSQNILILKCDGEVVKTYTVATGANNITPVGTFKIVNKLVNPVWFKSGAIIPPESPKNILGTRWLGFDIPGYGIHGTTEPDKVGQQVTAGCVRMRNPEVEELFSLLPEGTEVVIVD